MLIIHPDNQANQPTDGESKHGQSLYAGPHQRGEQFGVHRGSEHIAMHHLPPTLFQVALLQTKASPNLSSPK